MKCCRKLPVEAVGNAIGNTPMLRPVGKFGALLPMLPFLLLNITAKEEEGNRTRIYAYVRIKGFNLIGNGNRQQRLMP